MQKGLFNNMDTLYFVKCNNIQAGKERGSPNIINNKYPKEGLTL